jgi:hypothetical protein
MLRYQAILPGTACGSYPCLTGWSEFQNVECFKLYPIAQGTTFEIANSVCWGQNNAQLASVHSAAENTFIVGKCSVIHRCTCGGSTPLQIGQKEGGIFDPQS